MFRYEVEVETKKTIEVIAKDDAEAKMLAYEAFEDEKLINDRTLMTIKSVEPASERDEMWYLN